MFEVKLQTGCLLIVFYFISAYVRETKNRECNRIFDALLIVAPMEIIFDAATAWTVNRLDTVPAWLNLLLHACFLICINLVIILDYLYMIDKAVGLTSRIQTFLVLIPGIISMIGIIVNIPRLEYLSGERTNYSMGVSVFYCFASLVIHFILIMILVIGHHRTIERVRIFDISAFIFMVLFILAMQIIFPEILASALLPTVSLIVLYMAYENPAFLRLQRYNNEMVMGFATLVDNRDDSTGGHIKRTKGYVEIILKELKKNPAYKKILTQDYITNVINAAPLHDIGKIATPDQILQKPGKLTKEEFDVMKLHSQRGGEIIRDTFSGVDEPRYRDVAYEVATYHHEKWNGNGYPEGLKASEIPLHARIMAVADVFDAVSAKRCYRDALPLDECYKIIADGAGTDFDPDIVAAFFSAKKKIESYFYSGKTSVN